jgi:hypothetical protein
MSGAAELLPTAVGDIAGMVPVDAIFGHRPAPMSPWSDPVIPLAIAVLPTLEDDLAADLVECLAFALVDRREELRAVRTVLSAALEQSHTLQVENLRLRRRVGDLLKLRRTRGTR